MSRSFDVCIRGAGIVGSTLALLLSQQRLRVALVGKAPSPQPVADVRAYSLNTASRHILESVRAWPQAADTNGTMPVVTPVSRMVVKGDMGATLAFDAADVNEQALNWMVDVPALEARLAQAVQFQGQIECFSDDPANPAEPTAKLTVVCEGRRSSTRAAMGVNYETRSYPHRALAARLTLEQPHQGVARQWFCEQGIVALLPLGGEQGTEVALVWSTTPETLASLAEIPPEDFISRINAICMPDANITTLTQAPQVWPLEFAQASQWTAQGMALAGDAAHAMHPLAGQGLNVGLADVTTLAQVLQEREYWRELGDPRLLRRYERNRKAAFVRMGGLTDGLFQLFQQELPALRTLRNWGMTGLNQLPAAKRWLTRQAMA